MLRRRERALAAEKTRTSYFPRLRDIALNEVELTGHNKLMLKIIESAD